MNIDDMIAVLEAAKRGEKIEYRGVESGIWKLCTEQPVWNFSTNDYRIAPKPQMTLVEELRWPDRTEPKIDLMRRAADRICDLERINYIHLTHYTTDELLAELKRRTTC
jgi:hypothetical protein